MHTRQSLVRLLAVLLFGMTGMGHPDSNTTQASSAHLSAASSLPAAGDTTVYLPIVRSERFVPRVNVPYFAVADVYAERFDEMSIFWLGQVTPTENYADVRMGYNNTYLKVRLATFDRLLWYDTSPSVADLEDWDAVSLYLDLDGNLAGLLDASSYRLVAQLSDWPTDRTNWQTAYRGTGAGWTSAALAYTTVARWRGDGYRDMAEDRGWEASFTIPFASLGLSGPPAPGTLWRFGIAVHDRDDSAGTPIADQLWPPTLSPTQPASWGELRYGMPSYSPPPATLTHTVVIREGLAGAHVPDAAVGSALENQCPGNAYHIWNEWANRNYGSSRGLNIQNQRDYADWPCFAKYFVRFPLTGIPQGASIISATLTLHHWGNSGDPRPGQGNSASPSFIHVLTVPSTWSEATVTWNNAPLASENVSQAWVPVQQGCTSPCTPRDWDVSYAVSKASALGDSISFALYSSDSAYSSGKYFSASDTADWEAVARPTLTVVWGEP
jgi:hypothetical protein